MNNKWCIRWLKKTQGHTSPFLFWSTLFLSFMVLSILEQISEWLPCPSLASLEVFEVHKDSTGIRTVWVLLPTVFLLPSRVPRTWWHSGSSSWNKMSCGLGCQGSSAQSAEAQWAWRCNSAAKDTGSDRGLGAGLCVMLRSRGRLGGHEHGFWSQAAWLWIIILLPRSMLVAWLLWTLFLSHLQWGRYKCKH